MSKPSNAVVGFSLSPFSKPSPQLAHFNRLISSTGGTDRVFMLFCYSAKIFNYILVNPKLATKSTRDIAERINKIAAVISDARVLYVSPLETRARWNRAFSDGYLEAGKKIL